MELSKQTALAILKGAGKKYKKIPRTVAYQMDADFSVTTDQGVENGKKGDFLCLDLPEELSVCPQAAFVAGYKAVERKKDGK